MADFLGHFIPWKDWNKELTILNSLNKAFYIETKFYTKEEPDDSLFMDHNFCETRGHNDDNSVVYFSAKKTQVKGTITRSGFFKAENEFSSKEQSLPRTIGWETSIRAAVGNDSQDKIFEYAFDTRPNSIFDTFNLDNINFNSYHDTKRKRTSLPKGVQEWRDEQASHTDRYGIPIEMGDYIAYTVKDSKYVTIEKVTKITETRVNSVEPYKIILVRAKDSNKKLGW